MCGRYATFGPVSVSRQAREVLEELELDIISEINQREPQYNIVPTELAPVVVHGEGQYHVRAYRWGLVPFWAKDTSMGARMINARMEGLVEGTSKAFAAAFKRRRCLVPASGYFEWTGEPGHKQPYFIRDPGGGLLMFAGLWEGWRPSEAAGWTHTYTILTSKPGKVSGDAHDRQPVILPPDLWDVWMTGPPGEAGAVLAATPDAELMCFPVSKAVNRPTNKGAELVEPISL